MRAARTLWLYLVREALQYAGIGFFAVSGVLIAQNLLRRLEDLAGLGVRPSDVLELVWALFLMLSSYAVPVAFLFGILVAVGRLSSDSEITAMRSVGVSFGQILLPFVLVALGVGALTGHLLAESGPSARRQLRALAGHIAARGGLIEAGRFNELDRQGSRLLFADDRDEKGQLAGVLIADHSDPQNPFTVLAEHGHFAFDERTGRAQLVLRNGDIHFTPPSPEAKSYRRIAFGVFRYSFELGDLFGASADRIRPSEMTTPEVRDVLSRFQADDKPPPGIRIKTRERYEIQIHRRIALAAAPLLFALVGVPLGLRRTRGARSLGSLLCAALVFGYYMLLSAGTFLAEQHRLPASVALWIPNVIFTGLALGLDLRASRAGI